MTTEPDNGSPGTPAWTVVSRPVGTCQIRFRLAGKQCSISSGTKDITLAERAAPELIRRWLRARGAPVAGPAVATLSNQITRFITLAYSTAKHNTRREVETALNGRLLEVAGDRPMFEVTTARFEAWEPLLKAGLGPKTWKNRLTIYRKFLRWQAREGLISDDPTRNIATPKKRDMPRRSAFWADADFDLVAAHLSPEDAEILSVLRWTGMDAADLYHLRPEHIESLPEGLKIFKLREKAKSDEETIDQPVSSRISAIISARLQTAGTGPLWSFPQYSHSFSFADALLRRVKHARAAAGLRPAGLKSIRHWFAVYHARRGVPMEELRRWMGHAPGSRVLEAIYARLKSSHRFMD